MFHGAIVACGHISMADWLPTLISEKAASWIPGIHIQKTLGTCMVGLSCCRHTHYCSLRICTKQHVCCERCPQHVVCARTDPIMLLLMLQVHEKSILLPLLPITLLAAADPDSALWAPVVAAFQMYPLLERDGAAGVYFAANLIYIVVASAFQPARERQGKQHWLRDLMEKYQMVLLTGVGLGALGLHVLRLLPAPASLPWLWDRLHVTGAFAPILGHMIYTNVWQWKQGGGPVGVRSAVAGFAKKQS